MGVKRCGREGVKLSPEYSFFFYIFIATSLHTTLSFYIDFRCIYINNMLANIHCIHNVLMYLQLLSIYIQKPSSLKFFLHIVFIAMYFSFLYLKLISALNTSKFGVFEWFRLNKMCNFARIRR